MSDIIERLRKHVHNRGGAALQNGAWAMMLEAADWIEHLEAVDLARAKLFAAANEWQPIETATRDGTSLLVCDETRIDCQKVVFWDDNPERLPYGWCVEDAGCYHETAFTHWMPLPSPPVEQAKSEKV